MTSPVYKSLPSCSSHKRYLSISKGFTSPSLRRPSSINLFAILSFSFLLSLIRLIILARSLKLRPKSLATSILIYSGEPYFLISSFKILRVSFTALKITAFFTSSSSTFLSNGARYFCFSISGKAFSLSFSMRA